MNTSLSPGTSATVGIPASTSNSLAVTREQRRNAEVAIRLAG
ncbi:hypothetical protein SK571_00350 [Lentzea sp. BCCO 10_0798]|uniref:Uncharacterized protein n=1 Tax=Lentzea kristufekii TaxID=3095430 RepID=A0ABU4THR5_9PSEU|nr:hypothetical protein [Lentzea sp. BCCO 10_0798]MDX8047816.1 hypothetical protein [Lentzea sp. BCCO 10_0798]